MNFRKLELTGFKSFADKVELVFEPGITAIVGPNGCGKSNIADAIKWALGEQNARAIRCEKMEDIIFNGGSSRRPLGMSQVSLTISNIDKILPADYTEIELERRFFRSGESEYYINRNRCLLKDIQELFMDTGLGVNSYSIMEQGHIDLILNSSLQDRRLILEEAAGITKYRHRKKASLRKLEITEQNLLRISDILHELEGQVASLKRQESRARAYQRYYAELKELDTVLSRRRYNIMITELKDIQDSITRSDDKASLISTTNMRLEAELESHRLEITELDRKLADLRSSERKVQTKIEETESDIAVHKERRTNLQQQQQRISTEIAMITERMRVLDKQIADISSEKDTLSESISSQENELRLAQESVDMLTKSTADAEKNVEELKAQSIDIINKKARIQTELSATDSRLDYLVNSLSRLNISAENLRTEQSQLRETLTKLQEDADAKENEINTLIARQSQVDSEIGQLRSRLAILEENIRETEQKRVVKSSRLQSLQELQRAYEGFSAGVKAILGTEKRTDPHLKGICGVIAEIIRTEPKYENAIEASLGSNIQCIVTETIEDAKAAVEYLKTHKAGRAIFLSLDSKIPRSEDKSNLFSNLPILQVVEFDVRYSSVIQYLMANTFIVEDLDTAVKLAKLAREQSETSHSRGETLKLFQSLTFVTLDGQVVSSTGMITGGTGSEGAGLLRRSREIRDLKKELAELDEQLLRLTGESSRISSRTSSLQQERDKVVKEIQSSQLSHTGMQKDISQYQQRLERLEKEISIMESEHDALEKEIAKLEENKAKLAEDAEELERKGDEINKNIDKLQTEMRVKVQQRDAVVKRCTDIKIQLASKKQQEKGLIENLKSLEQERSQVLDSLSSYQTSASSDGVAERDITDRISTQEKLLEEFFSERSRIEGEISDLESQRQKTYVTLMEKETLIRDNRRDLDQIKQERYQLEVVKTQLQMNIDSLASRMRERYGISLADPQTLNPDSLSALEAIHESPQNSALNDDEIAIRIEELRTKMERLGPVNLTAVDEYSRQKERYDLMGIQKDDLIKAKDSLYDLIQRINRESRELLKETFDSVNANFQELFQRLFGGGHGELLMLGEGDVLDSGIEITARPPGKKTQTVSMLSTGERSLVAIAILFALFRIKPSPFCVMDEVDAALDDANVVRFTDMLKEFSSNTQFIIITHNKRTMEIADVLYGVTMEESGVSKLVSLRINSKS